MNKRTIVTLILALSLALCLFALPAVATDLEIPEEAVGIWFIPNLHLKTYVYKGTWDRWQDIVDAPESALMRTWSTARVIGDHCNTRGIDGNGLWNMSSIRLGDCAYLITPEGKYKYQCYLTAIVDVGSWGFTINGKVLEPASSTDIANTCCVGHDTSRRYIAVFRYVKEIK